ncbi:MAG: starch-binding protein [Clostridiales bacterium]|jgi:hypothetical protein|nr:starch-binding protein [Clostridiales bacterium]
MKKRRLFFAALIMAFSMVAICHAAYAAAPEGMAAAYVSVPEDWENPSIWAWDDAGNNAFTAWPGGEAEALPDNPGWYYIYLPNWATNIIVNANDGTVQTNMELKAEGGDFWVTVTSPDEAAISFEPLTEGDAPEYVEKITVYARVPEGWESPSLWAWLDPDGTNAFAAWPGEAMRESGDWHSAKAPSWINSVIINANAGAVQTADIKDIEQGIDIWVIVADDLTAVAYYENPDLIVPDITVRAKVPADWEAPNLWAWLDPDGTNAFPSWPGQALTLNGDWHEITLPGWVNSFIINANGGSVQTGDMKGLETGKDIWITVTDAENYTYEYEEPASESPSESVLEPAEAALAVWKKLIDAIAALLAQLFG